MLKSLIKTVIAASLTALASPVFAQAANELVVWHAYRGAEKAAFEKVVGMFEK